MNGYNLTDAQKELLRKLVRCVREGKLEEPLLPIGTQTGYFFQVPGEENIGFKWTGDLDALCDANLMSFRWNRKRTNRLYGIKQAGYDAVDNDFEVSPSHVGAEFNIGAIINTMSGGSVQAVGVADNAEISQVVNDPALLHSQVETLTERLLDEVKSALAGNELIEYAQTVQSLKEQLLTEEPDPSLLKRLTRTLGLLGDIEGTMGLMVRVWPCLYPLLLIAAERLR